MNATLRASMFLLVAAVASSFVATLLSPNFALANDGLTASEIVVKVVAERNSVRSGEWKFERKNTSRPSDRPARYHVILDGRSLHINEHANVGPNWTKSHRAFVFGPQRHISYNDLVATSPPLAKIDNSWTGLLADGERKPHPWALGFVPLEWENSIYFPWDEFMKEVDQPSTQVETLSAKGLPDRIQLSSESNDRLVRITVTPEHRWFVNEVYFSWKGDDHPYIDIVQSNPAFHKPSKRYWPDEVHYKRLVKDKIESEQKIVVETVHINGPVAPESFLFESIGARPGTVVITHPDRREFVWDGKKLEPRDGGFENPPDNSPPRTRYIFLIVNLVVFSLIAAICMFRVMRGGVLKRLTKL